MASSLKNKINFFNEFKPWYLKIIKDFDFDYQKDCYARDFLSQILKKKNNEWNLDKILARFRDLIYSKKAVFIYGCGPSLEETVNYILNELGIKLFDNWLNFTADGAIRLLIEKNIQVDGNFTDLDGITKNDFEYSTFNIVHAHGDNIEKLKYFKKQIITFENLVATSQVEPVENVINPGGFTDGDRSLFFLKSFVLPIQNIYLVGMDFNDVIGKYSKPKMIEDKKASPIKKKKLAYAKDLIEWLATKIENKIFFINSDISSKYFKKISLIDIEKLITTQLD
ncbi:MAG: 6-hydroxymethylpterin diphosphokinase MptE-like protein [Candidatus Hodarchaeota archaeon]